MQTMYHEQYINANHIPVLLFPAIVRYIDPVKHGKLRRYPFLFVALIFLFSLNHPLLKQQLSNLMPESETYMDIHVRCQLHDPTKQPKYFSLCNFNYSHDSEVMKGHHDVPVYYHFKQPWAMEQFCS